MYKHKPVLFTLVVLCIVSCLKAQITVSPSVGCSPALIGVNFQYTGSATNLTNIVWNFGDNTPVSNSLTPVHNYVGTGTFIVTFNATGVPTSTAKVIVHQSPAASFNFAPPASHCAPMVVPFTGSSSSPNSSFNWVYGDGGLGSGSSNNYTYTIPGNFTAILTVKDLNTGCTGTVSHGPISVSTPPNIIISTNPGTYTCTAPFTTAFTASNSTSGSPITGGGLTYNWNFGNSQTSGAATPGPITYNTQGIYITSLTVTDNNSCSKTNTLQISIFTPTVSAVVPPSVCIQSQMPISPPFFTVSVQSNQTVTTWQMGDGNTKVFPSANYNPPVPLTPNVWFTDTIHAYTTPGLKTLTISASAGACVGTTTATIFVEKITPNFTINPSTFACSPSLAVTYINTSTVNSASPLSYTWFATQWQQSNPPYTSTLTNGTFTFIQNSVIPWTIYRTYKPKVTLVAVSAPLGCVAKVDHVLDSIKRPTAWFNMDKGEGCAPLTVNFRDSSFTNPVFFPITSYTWNSGTVPPVTSSGSGPTIPNFSFTYTNPGVYSPFLSIQTASGCTDVSFLGTVTVVNPVTPSFTLPNSPFCAGVPITLTMSAAPGGTAQHWHAHSDAGFFSGCVSDSTPTWFFTHPGTHPLIISAYKNSCVSTVTVPNAFTVKGPVGKFNYETNCASPTVVKFNYNLLDVGSATLNFGDAQTQTLTGTPNATVTGQLTHTYSTSGDYIATLVSNNSNGCPPYTFTMLVTVRQLSVDFNLKPVICKEPGSGSSAFPSATVTLSQDVFKTVGWAYTWLFDNLMPETGTNTLFVSGTTFSTLGQHTLALLVKDFNGCTQLVTKNFTVTSPTPSFTFNSNPICVSDYPVQILNLTSQAPYAVPNYTWVMGDGVPFAAASTTLVANNSPTNSPTFSFPMGSAVTNTFSVLLKAQDINGCIDSTRRVIKVNDPQAFFYPTVSGGCYPPGPKVTFLISTASSYTNYLINFGDSLPYNGNISSPSFGHKYSAPGTYTPTIKITDNAGCVKSFTSSPFVVQNYPTADFIFGDAQTGEIKDKFCLPAIVQYTNTSVANPTNTPYTINWNGLGNGQPIVASSVVATQYTNNSIYTVSLTIATIPSQCASTKVYTIAVFKPLAEMTVSQKTICLGQTLEMKIKDRSGVEWWVWEYGVNSAQSNTIYSSSQPANPTHTYTYNVFPSNPTGTVTVRLLYSDPYRACISYRDTVIKILKIDANFKRNKELTLADTVHCLEIADEFNYSSYSNSSSALSYSWNYGAGLSSSSPTLNYTFPTPGIHTVAIQVLDPVFGCTAAKTKTIEINPLPTAFVTVKDTSCPNAPFIVNGGGTPGETGTLSGTLAPSPGSLNLVFSPQNTFSVTASASVSSSYSLTVTDENGCVSKPVSDYIYVQQAAAPVRWDTTVIIGQTTPINSYAGSNFTYTWSPLVRDLSCITCFNPISTTTSNITYSVVVEDTPLSCFKTVNTYRIFVDPSTTVDVPTAFTPNGDGTNDVIFPDGWGIRKLHYFKVFNRWGQLLFESNDLKVGWDGRFNGVLQNMETYVYQVSVETYTNESISKSGTFKLIR